jgi:tetratricopeptide (TPR) repeat protein
MKLKKTIYFLASIFLLASFAFAQPNRGVTVKVKNRNGGEREVKLYDASYALIIGNSSYKYWDVLNGVKTDVAAVEKSLRDNGFTVETAENLDSSNLSGRIEQFVKDHGYEENNRLLIYYAGHGYTQKSAGDDRELGYIVPVDAPLPGKDKIGFLRTAVDLEEIRTFAKRIQAKHALFLFDSCFSGRLVSRGEIAIPPIIQDSVSFPVRQFITAGAANQSVPDESIFRRAFTRGLEGEADLNNDGYILASEFASYLRDKVTNYSNRRQTPLYAKIDDISLDRGDFVFTVSSAAPVADSSTNNLNKAVTLTNQALSAAMSGNFIEAEKLANQSLTLNQNSALGYGIRGWSLMIQSKYDLSLVDLEKAVSIDPNNILLLARLSMVYRRLEKTELAQKMANEVLRKAGKAATVTELYAKGLAYFVLGNYNSSISEHTKAIQIQPNLAVVYYNRAISNLSEKNNNSAIIDFNKAIELNPEFASAYTLRGDLHISEKNYDLAIQDLDKSIGLYAEEESLSLRGLAYFEKKEYEKAIQDFDRAILFNPKNPLNYFDRGHAYYRKGYNDSAIKDLTKTVELDAKSYQAFNLRGICYYEKGMYAEAINDYNKAIAIMPNEPALYENRADAYEKSGKTDLAAADRRKAAQLKGNK